MSGNATLTIVASMNAMKTPIEATNRTDVGVTARRCRASSPLSTVDGTAEIPTASSTALPR